MISIVLAGRNDDYGGRFRERLFRAALTNAQRLSAAGIAHEFLLVEWNPVEGQPWLAREFVTRVPRARALVVPPAVHAAWGMNPHMPFHEMPAKNAGIRRARGEAIIVTNADVIFGEPLIERLRAGAPRNGVLLRAHRIDVPPDCPLDALDDPAHWIESGEGLQPPRAFLGAGGDFCLATARQWRALRGFDERIRFSTRGKDWQFFLAADARGVDVEFIGRVYHLDHAEGFRNTDPSARTAASVHFGRPWDIEFGLPMTNPDDWGLGRLGAAADAADWRIQVLEPPAAGLFSSVDHEVSRRLHEWVTPPADDGRESATLLHAILEADRRGSRLIARLADPRALAALSGFDRVARAFGVSVHCNHRWPALPGLSVAPFSPEPVVCNPDDLVVTDRTGTLTVERPDGRPAACLPTGRPPREPAFDPLLARRWLRVLLAARRAGHQRLGLYGAGSHTRALLAWGVPDDLHTRPHRGHADRRRAAGDRCPAD